MLEAKWEAKYYEPLNNNSVKCLLCPQDCEMKLDHLGFCKVRRNIDGKLYSLNYGKVASYGIDPIEKKPLYHFHPGSQIFSIGTIGCNFKCQFCQNWQISQQNNIPTKELTPEECVKKALSYKNNIGIAYTYSEPTVWYEHIIETVKISKEKGLKNVLITNGFIRKKPLEELLPLIDGMNIDVKGFTQEFYKKNTKGDLKPVLDTVEYVAGKCHIEITSLIIPGLNDSKEDIDRLASWISSIDKEIPLHLSRYFPNYKMNINPTPEKTMLNAWEIAREKLDYVYIGNMFSKGKTNTYCPHCKEALIIREGFLDVNNLEKNKCVKCKKEINLVL